ncbi:MAG: nucleotidyltransferase domain-containing protein [Deltaproteobacteria bacterium]|nr:nucleotidyltransferase domain-containing protein [Deltaproteobacteria bacterium]MBI3391413.1 nucleotidyltransferase domain-containing protein [Deltaproteobacteria bacterium]
MTVRKQDKQPGAYKEAASKPPIVAEPEFVPEDYGLRGAQTPKQPTRVAGVAAAGSPRRAKSLLRQRNCRTARFTSTDQAWLDAYRVALAAQCTDAVKQFLIYGSKARGEATRDSDLDVVLIVDNRWKARKRDLRRIGYQLASTSDVLPSIVVYTEEEWEARRQSGSFFRRAVERDAIAIR